MLLEIAFFVVRNVGLNKQLKSSVESYVDHILIQDKAEVEIQIISGPH